MLADDHRLYRRLRAVIVMMRPTVKLQYVRRTEGKEVVRVLQQQWIDDDPADEGPIKYEWRDVPEGTGSS